MTEKLSTATVDFDMKPYKAPDVDVELLKYATEALQAEERLHLQIKKRKMTFKNNTVHDESVKTLESLRTIRGEIDGTAVTFQPTNVTEQSLQGLKTLMLMHVPDSLTDDVRHKFQEVIFKAFQGSCKKVMFACLMTCPWYSATQEERGQQAKHNMIFVVYLSLDEQYFAPVNPHQRDQSDVVDLGWLYAAEATHFTHYICKGKVKFLEALASSQSGIIYEDEDWHLIRHLVDVKQVTSLRGFLEQTRGQAVGAVAKKLKSGRMGLRDGATLYEFCDSFRLLHHAEQALLNHAMVVDSLHKQVLTSSGKEALDKLTAIYKICQEKDVSKVDLLEVLVRWKEKLDGMMKGHRVTPPGKVEQQIGDWLSKVRMGPNFTPQSRSIPVDRREKVISLMEKVGGVVAGMKPEDILMVTQAGSYLYNLSTPDSDVDYVVIYALPTQKVISSCIRSQECIENRGPDKAFEYGAYEVRLFSEMIWKGSVVMLELLFAEGLEYTSPAWQALAAHRELFVTERAILQYLGLIKNNMNMIENKKYENSPRERKLFYQVFHKLDSLQYFAQGKPPPVHCRGEVRDFIMRIRKGPLQGDLSRDVLYKLAQDKILQLREDLSCRTQRLPENVNFTFLTNWLLAVRGWNKQ